MDERPLVGGDRARRRRGRRGRRRAGRRLRRRSLRRGRRGARPGGHRAGCAACNKGDRGHAHEEPTQPSMPVHLVHPTGRAVWLTAPLSGPSLRVPPVAGQRQWSRSGSVPPRSAARWARGILTSGRSSRPGALRSSPYAARSASTSSSTPSITMVGRARPDPSGRARTAIASRPHGRARAAEGRQRKAASGRAARTSSRGAVARACAPAAMASARCVEYVLPW
jgi:hypothetical protein